MQMKGAQCLIRIMEEMGVRVIFGYPGGAVLPIYDALLESEAIQHVLVRNEQAAPHMASGYARTTEKPGVCMATSGPGATNLVTGLATAYMDSVPVVAITGQVGTGLIGTDAFQEVDITGITMPITKHNFLIKDPAELPRVVREAFYLAGTGRPGPVLIDVPRNVAEAVVEYREGETIEMRGYRPTSKGHTAQIKKAARLIGSAARPVILAGGGLRFQEGYKALASFAERVDAPVTTTLNGIGLYPETGERALGMLGMHGRPAANLAVSQADLLIGVGVRFGDRATGSLQAFAKNARVIHVDVDPAEIGKNVPVDVPIVGEARRVLEALEAELAEQAHPDWMERIRAWKDQYPMRDQYGEGENLKPQRILETLGELARERAVITTDVGQHQMWTAQHFNFSRPKSFVSSGGLGTMGYGFPAALGVQKALPGQLVVCVTGDGSFQMSMAEMATAQEQCLPVKIILMNNASLSLVRQLQHYQCGGRYSGITFTANPDFSRLASAYGADTFRITKNGEIREVLTQALASEKLTLVECLISNEEMVFPFVPGNKGLEEMVRFEKDVTQEGKTCP